MKIDKPALIKQGWLRAIVGLVVFYLVVDNSVYIPRLIMQLFGTSIDRLGSVTNSVIFMLLAVYLFRRFVDRQSFVSLGFAVRGFGRDVILGLLGPLLLMGTGFLVLHFLGNIEITSFNPSFGMLLYWAIGLLFAAALEEVPLRGYMLNNMMQSMNKYIAVGIISVIFGLLHATGQNVNIIGILNCTLLGLLVGLYYVRKRNIWVPLVFHTAWNFFQGTVFGFEVSGRPLDYNLITTEISGNELLTGGGFGLEGSLILTLLTVLMITVLEMREFKRRKIRMLKS
ncbi:MAG: CPBP family intramembrane metalloprotease [Candidatus Zixiibacteriota bacterium]|nr:MAG: CPBP family intramembrane metalloprotease [candidate division Zixibacteria bacterium]